MLLFKAGLLFAFRILFFLILCQNDMKQYQKTLAHINSHQHKHSVLKVFGLFQLNMNHPFPSCPNPSTLGRITSAAAALEHEVTPFPSRAACRKKVTPDRNHRYTG